MSHLENKKLNVSQSNFKEDVCLNIFAFKTIIAQRRTNLKV